MKNATPGMQAHLQGDCTTLARLYKITRKDGTIFAFTDHDQDISTINYQSYFDDGGFVYEAAAGFSPTATENKSDLTVDNQEATVFIDSDTILESDLRFGIWDAAAVEIRIVNWDNLTDGAVKQRKGELGTLTMKNGVLTAEVLGLTNKLQVLVGRSFGAPCDAQLGDNRCKAVVPTQSGSVNIGASLGPNNSHQITPYSGLTVTVGYYNDGIVTFNAGVNSGLSFQVGTWDGITLSLKNALLAPCSDGDTFVISPGCNHNVTDCVSKFAPSGGTPGVNGGNIDNYQGFPVMPGQDSILNYPDATA